MEGKEHNTVSFMRLVSEESYDSSVFEDSCEYYQTEIFDQLPSSKGSRQGDWGAAEAPGGEKQHHAQAGASRDKASTQSLRNMPMCIQGKRGARDRRKLEQCRIGCAASWRQGQNIARRRLWEQMGGAISGLLPWRHTLHTIEGRFGVGVKAYFVFLRYLVYLNLLHCLIIGSAILGPLALYGRGNTSESLSFRGNDSVLDFFLGSGYLERSPMFYGFYTRGSLDLQCLNTPLLFLITILSILILSLIMVVRRTVVGYKHTWLLGNKYNFNVSYKIFCGWDFCIQDPAAAKLKHSFIRNDLKLYLEEERFHLREAQRLCGQWARLYLLRAVLNFLVVALLGGAFSLIYYATVTSQKESKRSGDYWLLTLFLQYLPPIVIGLVNFVFPHVFRKFSSFEDYSLTTQVNTTLVRSIFLKLACLGIFLFFLFGIKTQECWENRFGREMYKLSVFDFLASFCNAFFVAYPRKWLVERFPSCCLARLLGKQRFLIPFNVLDLVYSQTVTWVGVFYCPLLPLLGTVKLVAILYINKFIVLRCCVPEQRMFRASSSSVLFHCMLLLGLLMAAITLGINLNQFRPSLSCGPFQGSKTVFAVTDVCVDSLPSPAQTTLRYLASEAFAMPLILAQIILLTSYVSRRRANCKTMERLKEMLVICSSDKRFLVKQHFMLVKRQKKTLQAPATGTK